MPHDRELCAPGRPALSKDHSMRDATPPTAMNTLPLRTPLWAALLLTCQAISQSPLSAVETIQAGFAASEIVADDWNQDGLQDYAIGSGSTVAISLSITAHVHAPPLRVQLPQLALSELRALASGDLDGDGLADLAVLRPGPFYLPDGVVTVMRNLGGGVFDQPVDHPVILSTIAGSPITPTDMALCDMNGDGRLDVVASAAQLNVPGQDGYFAIALNRTTLVGQIAFDPSVGIPTNRTTTRSITAFDADLDGDIDLAVCNELDMDVSVLHNDGSGIAGAVHTETLTGAVTAPIRIEHGDVDNDGLDDLIVLNVQGHTFSLIKNRGACQWNDMGQFPVGTPGVPPPTHCSEIVVTDVDGDGNQDLVAGLIGDYGNPGYLAFLPGNGNATFGPEQQLLPGHQVTRLLLADLDGDSDQDLIAMSAPSRTITVMENTSNHVGFVGLGHPLPGSTGTSSLEATGDCTAGTTSTLQLRHAPIGNLAFLLVSASRLDLPFARGVVVPNATPGNGAVWANFTDPQGRLDVQLGWPQLSPGFGFYFQYWLLDTGTPEGFSASNAIRSIAP